MINASIKWLALIGLAFFISSCTKPEPALLKIQGQTMGTYYQVTYVLSSEQTSNKQLLSNALKELIDQQLELVNDQMSTYRPNSELSLFNKSESTEEVSDATIKVVSEALKIYQQSGGAFDVTVGPLVNLWGFGPDKKPNKIPDAELIEKTKQSIGSQYLSIDGNKLIKSKPDLYVDLSSIAKGYGVDAVAEFMETKGINNYLVDIGGELRASGTKLNQQPWTLAIERPGAGQDVQRLLHIGDSAIATSGDYRNYFEADGIRYSHTIDPKTGRPINHKLVSVTVIDESSMVADGLATAITVLGPEDGLEFATKLKQPVFLLTKQGDGFIESFTPEFEQYLVEEK
ncbi:FAD:protein FMN transferase ApbE [Psychromonas sp. B3M02]|uniref:FAD:protein FMN transferase n=1 Tax=Psychromonas sp. B3M02 TaxID=2267226 RepID=UPI000DE9F49A|nr:FAD:protein FMN transferase [Psychromonas sp. B3M02]RBW42757.1 FAD:protein FMN transferase ApbE [Psychromonas sp. B3M02]